MSLIPEREEFVSMVCRMAPPDRLPLSPGIEFPGIIPRQKTIAG